MFLVLHYSALGIAFCNRTSNFRPAGICYTTLCTISKNTAIMRMYNHTHSIVSLLRLDYSFIEFPRFNSAKIKASKDAIFHYVLTVLHR